MLIPTPMPFKTNRLPDSLSRLSEFSILSFSGADAAAFLQAQTMNDVLALTPGRWQWNGWLSPKGRVIALFALVRTSDLDYLAVLPDFPADELQGMLQRYVFRSKVRIQAVSHLRVAGAMDRSGPCGEPPDEAAHGLENGSIGMDWSGVHVARELWLVPDSADIESDANLDAAWLATDIAHGFPRLSQRQRESWTPQMLSLERLNAYSLRKGCYPGQEIVARTHYLGQSRRGLAHVAGVGLAEGLALHVAGGEALGAVICASEDGSRGLAVVRLPSEPGASITVEGESVELLGFEHGLARPWIPSVDPLAAVGDSPAV